MTGSESSSPGRVELILQRSEIADEIEGLSRERSKIIWIGSAGTAVLGGYAAFVLLPWTTVVMGLLWVLWFTIGVFLYRGVGLNLREREQALASLQELGSRDGLEDDEAGAVGPGQRGSVEETGR